MGLFLEAFAQQLEPGIHAVLVLDQAGWHGAKQLKVPSNLTLLHLPPYSPELNPVERVWLYLRKRFLSHRVLGDYRGILDAICRAWNALTAETGRLKSRTAYPYLLRSQLPSVGMMRRHGIRTLAGRRFRPCTTDSRHNLPIAPNLLKQAFSASVPNRVWLADIAYLPTGKGWLYLAAMLDLATRKVVGPPRPAGRGSCGHGSAVLLTADGRCETTCGSS
jgi:hypothetical protein